MYCKLNIKYKNYITVIVNCIYPFRKIIEKVNKKFIKRIYGVLKMEEIRRKYE